MPHSLCRVYSRVQTSGHEGGTAYGGSQQWFARRAAGQTAGAPSGHREEVILHGLDLLERGRCHLVTQASPQAHIRTDIPDTGGLLYQGLKHIV
jgi:hypothetical protein